MRVQVQVQIGTNHLNKNYSWLAVVFIQMVCPNLYKYLMVLSYGYRYFTLLNMSIWMNQFLFFRISRNDCHCTRSPTWLLLQKHHKIHNKMELLQSQAPTKRELLESSFVRVFEFGNWTFDLRMWTLDIRILIWEPLWPLSLFLVSFESLLCLF